MKNKGITFAISSIFLVFILIFAAYNSTRYFYKPYETEVAYKQAISDSFKTEALFVRDEILLPIPKPKNVLGYTVEDGEVVIPKTVVAKTYQNKSDLKGIAKAKMLQQEIETLEKAKNSVISLSKIETVTGQINKTIGNLVTAVSTCDMSKLPEIYNNLQFQLAKRSIMNGNANFANRINQLNIEKESELSSIDEGKNISCQMNGYFSSSTDGFESKYSPKILEEMEFDEIMSAIDNHEKPKATNTIGKVMKDHNWSVAIVLPYEKSSNFYVGKKVKLNFNSNNCHDIPAVVKKLIPDKNEKDVAVILNCNYVNPFILSQRHPTIEINSKTYTGLKISQQALRFLDGKAGVYVIKGGTAIFKTIDVIYKTDNDVLCSINNKENNLNVFDEVIISGKDIYNGKIIESYTK